MNQEIPIDELIKAETEFLRLAMPSYSIPANDLISTECCDQNCVLFLRRIDVLLARFKYLQFYQKLDKVGKHEARYLFISCLYRRSEDHFHLISICEGNKMCPTMIGKVFGFSVNVLMKGLTDQTIMKFKNRPWYSSTIDQLSSTVLNLSKMIQFNSLGKLMLPPNFNSRIVDSTSTPIPISVVSKHLDLCVQLRRADTLVRCTSCTSLQSLIADSNRSSDSRKEAELMLKLHYKTLSQQRTVIDCINKQSRDEESDIVAIHMDAMSNKHSKLPHLVSRPKCIGDGDRICMNLTTVQIAANEGTHKFRNIEYPVIQSLYSHDSSFNISLLLNALLHLEVIPSTAYIVWDSCTNNKSHLVFGSLGFLLSKIHQLEQIILLYPSVGHTHGSCDSHFGVVTKEMMKQDVLDPNDYCRFLESFPSVNYVDLEPTIFDFSGILEFTKKVPGLCSNGQIVIAKSSDGTIHYSSASSINASLLFGSESNRTSLPLFTPEFYSNSYAPKVQVPDFVNAKKKIESLLKCGGGMFSEVHKENYFESVNRFGKKSFRCIVSEINGRPQKLQVPTIYKGQDPGLTVLKYLESCGINAGRIPKMPDSQASKV